MPTSFHIFKHCHNIFTLYHTFHTFHTLPYFTILYHALYHTPHLTIRHTLPNSLHSTISSAPYHPILITLYLSPLPYIIPYQKHFITGEGHGFEIAQGDLDPCRLDPQLHDCDRDGWMSSSVMCWRSTQRETFGKPLYRHVRPCTTV